MENKKSLRNLVSAIAGINFSIGLCVGGMTDPQKIIHFLDLSGPWDSQLLFVLIGALMVQIPAVIMMKRRERPLLAEKVELSEDKITDRPLIVGSLIFGVGWALAGYCPGSGLVSATNGNGPALIFVISMSAGMVLHHFYLKRYTDSVN